MSLGAATLPTLPSCREGSGWGPQVPPITEHSHLIAGMRGSWGRGCAPALERARDGVGVGIGQTRRGTRLNEHLARARRAAVPARPGLPAPSLNYDPGPDTGLIAGCRRVHDPPIRIAADVVILHATPISFYLISNEDIRHSRYR
jgi:hypothetical protein